MIKNIYLDGIGDVVLARRRGTRSIRLTISGGRVRLGVPYAVSDRQAVAFAIQRADWILKHKKDLELLTDGMRIGKAHHLKFEQGNGRITTKLAVNMAIVRLTSGMTLEHPAAQAAAKRIAKKALMKEAESLLPQRLRAKAANMGINYRSFQTKFIRSRWGSCSNQADIALNAYLIQLPWEIIDYVIVHELAHVKQHNHSPDFWNEVAKQVPDFKEKRKILKTFHTDVLSLPESTV